MAPRTTPAKKAAAHDDDQAAKVLRRFRIVFNAVKAHFRAVESKAGISGSQFWALSIVRAQPGLAVGELARAMDVHQSTASNLLRALQENGLVISDRVGDDRRLVQLTVTPKGLRALGKAPGPFTGVLPDALRRLDPAALKRLDRDLELLIQELHPDRAAARIPLGASEEDAPRASKATAAARMRKPGR